MKKYYLSIILIFFILLSCNNSEEIGAEITASSKVFDSNSLMQLNNRTNNDRLQQTLSLISYATARTLLNDEDARNYIQNLLNSENFRNSSTRFTSNSNNTISFNELLDSNNGFSNGFGHELNSAIEFNSIVIPCIGFGCHRPLIAFNDIETGKSNSNLSEFINNNNIELYFPRNLSLDYIENDIVLNHLYVTGHSLSNSDPRGFNLWQNNRNGYHEGEFLLFDDTVFNEQETNIIIVRPKRTRDYPYSEYDVNFEDFYNIE